VIAALRERIAREREQKQASLAERLIRLGQECAALPVLDKRALDELLAYDKNGLAS
jgi:antitoxin VapB